MKVEFLFDFVSPNAYLAHLVLPEIEARTGVAFDYIPVFLGGVFKATGNSPPFVTQEGVRNKPEYQALETRRFLARHGLESRFAWNPHFPVNSLQILRGAIVAQYLGGTVYRGYVDAVFAAMWRFPLKLDEPEVITEALRGAGLPAGDLLAGMRDPAVKAELTANTERAVEHGVFGLPSFFVGDELYFGKDRLREVEEAVEVRLQADGRQASG